MILMLLLMLLLGGVIVVGWGCVGIVIVGRFYFDALAYPDDGAGC